MPFGTIRRARTARGRRRTARCRPGSTRRVPLIDVLARLSAVGLSRGGTRILGSIDWTIRAGERWVIAGPNGSGKTTLVQVLSTYLHPSSGTVEVFGRRLGTVDARTLRRRIGYASAALAMAIADDLTPLDVVMTMRHAALAPWWHDYSADDRARARDLLGLLGVGGLAERTFGTLSSGERQRVQIARTLMADPEILILDEPAAGLDLGAREGLVARLAALAALPQPAAIVLVTHHLEEIPPGFTHALVLARGGIVAAGPIGETLGGDALAEAFALPLRVRQEDGRWSARQV